MTSAFIGYVRSLIPSEQGLTYSVTARRCPSPLAAVQVAWPGRIAAPGACATRSGSPGRDSFSRVPSSVRDQKGSVPIAVIGWLKSEVDGAAAGGGAGASAGTGAGAPEGSCG